MKDWFQIENIDEIDSPSLVLYEDKLIHNLHKMLDMADNDPNRLMPHVKTNKMSEVIKRMVFMGILNFKTSTIAEAEMVANEGGKSVLVAHQLVGPKISRYGELVESFDGTQFSTIIDNLDIAQKLHDEALARGITIDVFLDINNGMNRSGVEPGPDLDNLIGSLAKYKRLNLKGIHIYDGHFRDPDFQKRKEDIEQAFSKVNGIYRNLKSSNPNMKLICGGTPSFTVHLLNQERICSPGTCVLWDWGYDEKLTEQDFEYAALIISRVISKPTKDIVTIDLGHKSVAAENPIDKRVKFLNLEGYKLLSQSEEHGVLKVNKWDNIKVGDVLYGVPYHICPTINLHDGVSLIRKNSKVGNWSISARSRKISV
ncbi:D-TA family PLP-dependent enzyme [Flagellimonas meridianipacifica]|uniref:D-serine deaminase-like pyridoxal phosphate-dependent protein n=1 Tax=Flagellimonas meridianipacifica TaxID=1080225 RepID=A0A2T0MBR5_9FLAO|nr:D-TA family PLP-dependent enzyme [Allomuricauda pacifica]PRX54943.1 D-serine deaminase-like pyridoxal phosphate-dependent protein [Allomuricauda pacifica]